MPPLRPQPPKKPATTSRTRPEQKTRAVPARANNNNKQWIIIGGAGGGVLILILLIVALSGGDKKKSKTEEKPEKVPETKSTPAEALKLEGEARRKCDDGRKVSSKVAELRTAGVLIKETLYSEIEAGIGSLEAGIELYRRAAGIAGRKSPELATYETARNDLVEKYVGELESEGKQLCESAKGTLDAKLPRLSSAPAAERQALVDEIMRALEKMTNGLALYDRAAKCSGKKADVGLYRRTHESALNQFLPAIEAEAESACKAGLARFDSIKEKIGKKLQGAEKTKYKEDLQFAHDRLKHGIALYEKANTVSGRKYDLNQYTQALKLARSTMLETE